MTKSEIKKAAKTYLKLRKSTGVKKANEFLDNYKGITAIRVFVTAMYLE